MSLWFQKTNWININNWFKNSKIKFKNQNNKLYKNNNQNLKPKIIQNRKFEKKKS